jgi:probable rRNA maturation factor
MAPLRVLVYQRQKDLVISASQVKKIVTHLLTRTKKSCHEVVFSFVGKREISGLHATYFNDPTPTDCVTFPCDAPGEGGYTFLGEAYICPAVAIEYSQARNSDPYREATLYIVHTLLHLLGYDDIMKEDRKRMRQAERRWMTFLDQESLCLKSPKTFTK